MTEETTELDILRRQVYVLENSESQAYLALNSRYAELEEGHRTLTRVLLDTTEELRLANEDARTANLALDKAGEMLKQAEQALTELKKVDLIGPLTAEEWMEFRLRQNEDEDKELLQCCANTSAIRDDVFYLARSYAEDPVLGRAVMRRIIHGINGHLDLISDPHPAALRLHELLTRMADYYGVPMDYVHDGDHPAEL